MTSPLDVVQDGLGRLRDVNDQPMIMIFDSKPYFQTPFRGKKKLPKAKPRSFAFINVTKPKEENEDTRKLIRTHVMQNSRHREKSRASDCSKLLPQALSDSPGPCTGRLRSRSTLLLADPSRSLNPLVFPVQMKPYMHRLIYEYKFSVMHIIDPKQPIVATESAWFSMVMTDPALFHALLCTSSIYFGLLSGKNDLFSQQKHMMDAITLINKRIGKATPERSVTDGTMAAILFIAKAEYARRNYTNWNIHMNGLKRIVSIRGGMTALHGMMRQKIYDAELMGCIETGSKPRFQFADSYMNIGRCMPLCFLPPGFKDLAQHYLLDRHLLVILYEIEKYTHAFEQVPLNIDLMALAVHIRYQLLSWSEEASISDQISSLRQSVCFGSILYIKTLLPKASARGIDYTAILGSLKTHILECKLTDLSCTNLKIWLLFVGGCTSESFDKVWYTKELLKITSQVGIRTWDDAKLVLENHWWIESVHQNSCHQLWEEIEAMRSC